VLIRCGIGQGVGLGEFNLVLQSRALAQTNHQAMKLQLWQMDVTVCWCHTD
jgi:hypothetical protein